ASAKFAATARPAVVMVLPSKPRTDGAPDAVTGVIVATARTAATSTAPRRLIRRKRDLDTRSPLSLEFLTTTTAVRLSRSHGRSTAAGGPPVTAALRSKPLWNDRAVSW